jgi:hypothetical protein
MGTTYVSAARALGAALEPVIGQVYFSPEAHQAYAELGFDNSAGDLKGVALPDGPAYFTSRGSVMGQVSGRVVAAAFAVFNPPVVEACVALGWSRTDAATICAARDRGAVGQLARLLTGAPDGAAPVRALLERAVEPLRPEGRPLFAGVSSLPHPATGLEVSPDLEGLWRAGDALREYRGDSHTAAWVNAGLNAVDIGLMTELYWGVPLRTYVRTRAWTDADLNAGVERLTARGWVTPDTLALTPAGHRVREQIEVDTDRQMQPALEALADQYEPLLEVLDRWGRTIRAGCGYPSEGPHDLAERAGRLSG